MSVIQETVRTVDTLCGTIEHDKNRVYILYDSKLSAILGVFSTVDKVNQAKNHLVKNDLKLVIRDIRLEILLSDNIPDDSRIKSAELFQEIYGTLTSKTDDLYSNTIMYKGQSITSRYCVYVQNMDELDSKTYLTTCILLPKGD